MPSREAPVPATADRLDGLRASQPAPAVSSAGARALAWAGRHPVGVSFAVALALRVTLALAVTVLRDGTLFLDDATYSSVAQAVADGDVQLNNDAKGMYLRTEALLGPITLLYRILGPVTLAGQLYVALSGAVAAALVARLALEMVSPRWALAAGLIAATLPSQVLWSSLILKDALVWASLAGLAVAVAVAGRSTGRRLAAAALPIAAVVVILGYLRLYTLEIALVAIVLASLFSTRDARLLRVAGATALLLCVPLLFGMGVAGEKLVKSSRNPATQRALSAEGNTRVVEPDTVSTHVGDQVNYLPEGVAVVALRPWPWEPSPGSTGMTLARAEAVYWYALVLLALIGLSRAWQWRRALAFPVFAAGALLVAYGLTEGNLGTAYRHRGEIVWAVAVFAVLGTQRLWQWREQRRASVP
jgi:hypothetical protein